MVRPYGTFFCEDDLKYFSAALGSTVCLTRRYPVYIWREPDLFSRATLCHIKFATVLNHYCDSSPHLQSDFDPSAHVHCLYNPWDCDR